MHCEERNDRNKFHSQSCPYKKRWMHSECEETVLRLCMHSNSHTARVAAGKGRQPPRNALGKNTTSHLQRYAMRNTHLILVEEESYKYFNSVSRSTHKSRSSQALVEDCEF